MNRSVARKGCLLLLFAAVLLGGSMASAADATVPTTVEAVIGQLDKGFEQRAEQYAPQVRTLENGVRVQRSPFEPQGGRIGATDTSYNTYVLNSDNRGCGACHQNLEDAVGGIYDVGDVDDYPHLDLHNSFGLEITAQMCMDCHDTSSTIAANKTSNGTFGALMHAMHDNRNPAFAAMSGNCWSCHYASADGMQLWDEVKHKVMVGITPIASDAMTGTFAWDQGRNVDRDDHFTYVWMTSADEYPRWAQSILSDIPEPETDGVYESWEFTVDGDVENPFTMTLAEMMERFPVETRDMVFECEINPMGGPLIANSTITGISVNEILEYAQPKDGASCIKLLKYYNLPLTWLDEYDAYLMLEIDGEPITYEQGYPVMFATTFGGAFLNDKCLTHITVNSEAFEVPGYYLGVRTDDGVYANNPNCGVFDLREGQIFELGAPIHFEGYAHATCLDVTAVELSFDLGNTWITMPIEGADPVQWIHWTYDWTPSEPGSYVIMARSVASDGRMSAEPVETLLNVQ